MNKCRLPNAWYELATRIDSARAVSSYLHEAINGPENSAFHIVNAVNDLLDLCEEDMKRLEHQIKGIDTP